MNGSVHIEESPLANRYELLEVIGEGRFATMYKACDLMLQRSEVALKIFHPHTIVGEDVRARLQAAVTEYRQLSHPNIVRIFDYGSLRGDIYFVAMEYVDGWSLASVLEKHSKKGLDEASVQAILSRILHGLSYAHQEGVVHGNLTPTNILFTKRGEVKLSDFGLATALDQDLGMTATGESVAVPHYMAPEQFQGSKPDQRSDLYSLGLIVYQMQTGKKLYEGEDYLKLAEQHIQGSKKLTENSLPDWCKEILRGSVTPLESRYDSSEEMLADVVELLNKRGPETIREIHNDLLTDPDHEHETNLRGNCLFGVGTVAGFDDCLHSAQYSYRLAPLVMRFESSTGIALPYLKSTLRVYGDPNNKLHLLRAYNGYEEESFKALLESGADPNVTLQSGLPLVHHAASTGRVDELDALLKAGVDLHSPNQQGYTPLDLSVIRGLEGATKLLLEAGASPYHLNSHGKAPIHYAVEGHEIRIFELILEHHELMDVRTRDGLDLLMLALTNFRQEKEPLAMLSKLLERNINPGARDNLGRTALTHAVGNRLLECARKLLKEGAEINAPDSAGRTPLMHAAFSGFDKMISLLLRFGAQKSARDSEGRTAVDFLPAAMRPELEKLFSTDPTSLEGQPDGLDSTTQPVPDE